MRRFKLMPEKKVLIRWIDKLLIAWIWSAVSKQESRKKMSYSAIEKTVINPAQQGLKPTISTLSYPGFKYFCNSMMPAV
jgi:hypothetical protein